MAKKLLTTVHLTDDKGQAHVFGPDDKDALPGWAEKQLSESWGDRDDLWETATRSTQGRAVAETPRDEEAAKAQVKAEVKSEEQADKRK